MKKGYISAFQSLGTVDGPGVRAVTFLSGCPLRCGYCHNPETWVKCGEEISAEELFAKIIKLKPYIKNGGVTFSGGEPLLQSEFLLEVAKKLKEENLSVAIDTSGSYCDAFTDELLKYCDIILLDIKFTTEEEYKKYTGGSLQTVLEFLNKISKLNLRIIIRQVIIENLNDTNESINRLANILRPYNIENVEFLPFKKLCLEKYESLGIDFPFKNFDETTDFTVKRIEDYYQKIK